MQEVCSPGLFGRQRKAGILTRRTQSSQRNEYEQADDWESRQLDRGSSSFVQNNSQQGFVDLDFSVVFDEAEFSEFVHEEIYARTRGADHFGQGFL